MTLRLLVIGAHPDDCELKAGGLAALYRRAGQTVRFVSVTNGEAGHHQILPEELVRVRRAETEQVSQRFGIAYEVLNFPDGQLVPSIEARFALIGVIRRFRPDLILTHRPNDYHPDHRATSQLVCDAAYMVTVPHLVADVPYLKHNPQIAYLSDDFNRPAPFQPTIGIDVGPVLEQMLDQMACHRSQFFEWLPFNLQPDSPLPTDDASGRDWLRRWFVGRMDPLVQRHRGVLESRYGLELGNSIQYAEFFEPCEYGGRWDEDVVRRLFPMLP